MPAPLDGQVKCFCQQVLMLYLCSDTTCNNPSTPRLISPSPSISATEGIVSRRIRIPGRQVTSRRIVQIPGRQAAMVRGMDLRRVIFFSSDLLLSPPYGSGSKNQRVQSQANSPKSGISSALLLCLPNRTLGLIAQVWLVKRPVHK
jgi:hypothetical protein